MVGKRVKYKIGNNTHNMRESVLVQRLNMFIEMIEVLRLCWVFRELGYIPSNLIYSKNSVLAKRSVGDSIRFDGRSSSATFNSYVERVFYRSIINASCKNLQIMDTPNLERLYSSSLIHPDNYPLHQLINVSFSTMECIRDYSLDLLKKNGYDVLSMRLNPPNFFARLCKTLAFK
jgi:hypothetical protein